MQDMTVQTADEGIRVVGELKTFWTGEPLDAQSYDTRRILGQAVRYMDDCGTRYGFISTYNETMLVRRRSQFIFEVSPVIKHDQCSTPQGKVSLREAMLFLALISSGNTWNFPKVGPAVTNGSYVASGSHTAA
ncbi:hypothetical protein ASPWEDRAFT_176374 [Aspergillus wentii DTO 134E9]|uniref:Fungal-type protein kinase domain-containing protein n=1 Tax=Aspergillus wentii DTO 134E9 TaxID=1073089 RepID=A0A1L9R8U8_ASPWE|nr:uncharacterized protein ASPWEDRAFT_176374 [Aspergillus wentii DTO 134E9]OJJ31287.1 hypothetical protein ASPWEDRAFT_176374 [Aspergillus wentii DTO 134E9]